jgi:hypothetical protein
MPAIVVAGGIGAAGAIGGCGDQRQRPEEGRQQGRRRTDGDERQEQRACPRKPRLPEREDHAVLRPWQRGGRDDQCAVRAGRRYVAARTTPSGPISTTRTMRSAAIRASAGLRPSCLRRAASKAARRSRHPAVRQEPRCGIPGRLLQRPRQSAGGRRLGRQCAGGVGTNFTNQVTNNNQNLADAQSNGALIKGNANANFGASVGNALGQFAGSIFSGGGFGGSFGKQGGMLPASYQAGAMNFTNRPTQYGGWI